MKLVVFAYHLVGARCLETLLNLGAEIPLVVTHEDDPKEEVWFPSVKRLALQKGLKVLTPERPNDPAFIEKVRGIAPDAIFSFYYRLIFGPALLSCAPRGAFNLHGSLLPKYRGRCPVNWALINGEKETGVTLHEMVSKPDAGDIVAQRRIPIEENDTAFTLFGKIAEAAAVVTGEFYPRLVHGTVQKIPQDHTQATVFGGRRSEDGAFSWSQDARRIYDLIRAVTHPYPGAFTALDGKKLFVWWAVPCGTVDAKAVPGAVVAVRPRRGVVVSAGKGALLLKRVQWEGEEEVAADVFFKRRKIMAGDVIAKKEGKS